MAVVGRRYGSYANHGFFLQLLLLFLFLFSFIEVPMVAATTTQSPPQNETQKTIMNDIANLVNSESTNTRWSTKDQNPCNWKGIGCTNSSSFLDVTSISLSNYGLSNSSIFAPLCCLETLLSLELSQNSFTNLSAQFFASSCSMKEGLQSLNLSTNQLANSLSDLSGFSQLEVLDLSFNYFASRNLSADLGSFPKLRSFNASSNKLNGEVPTSMVGALVELLLSRNQFSGSIPPGLFKYENLSLLDLSQNKLTGVVPDNFTSLSKLETLLLSGNQLTGEIPASLSNVTTLTRFAANENNFLGSIPPGVTKYVKMLDLSYNNISGNIPAGLFLGMNLETIDLTSNNLDGYVDAKFSRSLYCLCLGSNKLSGEIPGTISNALNLAYLELDNNNLEGNITLNLGGCKNLTLLNLASNRLQGQVPNEIGNLKNLVVLKLQMNNFSGSIPSAFSNFINLNALNLSYNSFSGSIPDGIMKLQNLSSMDLQANMIEGVIPNSISSLKILIELNLGNNLLTGSIPEMPASLSTALNLSHNLLSGNIPSNIGFLIELEILDLSYNNLSGHVPSSFGNLICLTELVLAYHQLSGSLPALPKHVAVNITGNPELTNLNSNTVDTGSKKKRHTLLIIIIAVAGTVMGLCLNAVIVTLSLSRKVYRIENEHSPAEEGATQVINGSFVTLNSIGTTAVKYMKEKQDAWRITPFQALNFELAEIHQGLTEENLVGSGGSGHVYRVTYTNRHSSRTGVVAVKQIRRFGSLDEKLQREFESEARILCNIRHNNIVKLLCCLSGMESKLLVYDYMDNGSLDRWLHGDYVPLDWPTRVIVAVGAAQGLCYMHHECSPPIIHRDVKTSNILLDLEFRAKVADFGLAKMLARQGEPNTMSVIAGSFGYMAPEYAYTMKVNEKVDVFSFGVVLLELTMGKKADDGGEQGSLAEWAGQHYRSGASIPNAADVCIRYAGYTDEVETVFRLGVQCTANSPSSRPSMKVVLQILLKCSEQTLRKSRLECS